MKLFKKKSEETKRAETKMLLMSLKPFRLVLLAGLAFMLMTTFATLPYIMNWVISLPIIFLVLEVIGYVICQMDIKKNNPGKNIIVKYMVIAAIASAICSCYNTALFLFSPNYGAEIWGGVAVGLGGGGALCLLSIPQVAYVWSWVQSVCNIIAIILLTGGDNAFVSSTLLLSFSLFISITIRIISNVYLERFTMQMRLDEQSRYVNMLLNDLEQKAGEWLWTVDENGIISDISDKICNMVGKSREELIGANRVNVLTDTFVQVDKMIEEKKKAELDSQTKSWFVANVSHEIRTPLNAMMGFLQLLLVTDVTDEQRDYLYNLQTSSQNLKHIIDEILDLSKIEDGKVELEEIPFNLKKTILNSIAIFKPLANEKGLTVKLSIDDSVPETVIGDSIRINQIVNNLLSNAIKFTSEGSVDASVHLCGQDETSYCVELIVRDTGIGISEETKGKLFEPYMQADSSTARNYGGTGLGLSIAYRLVMMMNGSLEVTSIPGEGSCFNVKIIVKKAVGHVNDDHQKNRVVKPCLPMLKRHLNILVVEDNALNSLFLTTALRKLNMVCDDAENGQIAVEKASHNQYDMILMDCHLPVVDGYAATESIRKLDMPYCEVPIIALTANATNEDRLKCLKAGMDDYLAKPIDLEKLREKVSKATPHKKQVA